MNIFILDENPIQNVQWYIDKHVVKMILEHAQMLSTAVALTGTETQYKPTHINHPCTIWTRQSKQNWLYLRKLTAYLHDEWRYRFNHKTQVHKAFQVIIELPIPKLPSIGLTPFAQAMDTQYKISNNPIENYRNYYVQAKAPIANWTKRTKPEWWESYKKLI